MKKLLCFLLLGVMMTTTSVAGGAPLNPAFDPLQTPRLLSFKKKINFESAVAKEKSEYVALDWSKIKLPADLSAWKMTSNEVTSNDDRHRIEAKFEHGANRAGIYIYVFKSDGKQKAANSFLLKADNTTMMEIFYVPSPIPVGTISIVDNIKAPADGLFLFHNVYTEISTSGKDDSLFRFAKWLQNEYEKNLKPLK